MKQVVAGAAPLLKAAGFRKRRHCFNREAEPGLVQVVWFWMGESLPPGPGSDKHRAFREALGLRGDYYGTFTIHLGVYVPEMVVHKDEEPRSWVNEYNCQIRVPIGSLIPPGEDMWWPLDPPDKAGDTAVDVLQEVALPWLDHRTSREAILGLWEKVGRLGLGLVTGRDGLVVAWLLKDSDRERAESILRDHIRKEHPSGPDDYLERVLVDGGFGHLLNEAAN